MQVCSASCVGPCLRRVAQEAGAFTDLQLAVDAQAAQLATMEAANR